LMHEHEWEHKHECGHKHFCGPPPFIPPGFGPPGFWPPPGLHVRGLLHLAILKILKEQPLHGSEIQRLLKERYGLEVSGPAVYGALKKLEAFGLVVATWDTTGPGPARRIYRITEEGAAYLDTAAEKLRKLKDFIDKLTS